MTRHLISTRARLVRCGECSRVIWFAYDGGIRVFCDLGELTLLEEIEVRLAGRRTYNYSKNVGIWYRNQWSLNHGGTVLVEHIHTSGFEELPPCRTETSKKVTDLSAPPF